MPLAEQLIYTRLEARYSNFGRSGFQVFGQSESLSKPVVTFICERIDSFRGSDPKDTRYQMFRLPDETFAFARTTPTQSDAEINDASGRGGIFISQVLVLTIEAFNSLGRNPLAALVKTNPILNPQDLILRYSENAENLPTIDVMPSHLPLTKKHNWTSESALTLIQSLVNAASGSDSEPEAKVILSGSSTEMLETLDLAFQLAPKNLLSKLTFDTHCHTESRSSTSFLIHGIHAKHSLGLSPVRIDAREKLVSSSPTITETPGIDYFNWLLFALHSYDIHSVIEQTKDATGFFSEPTSQIDVSSDVWPPGLILDVYSANRPEIDKALARTGELLLSKSNTASLLRVLNGTLDKPTLLDSAIKERFDAEAGSAIAIWVADSPGHLTKAEIRKLRKWAEKHHAWDLAFVVNTLASDKPKLRVGVLESMDQHEFLQLVDNWGDRLPASHFICDKHWDKLLASPNHPEFSSSDVVSLFEASINNQTQSLNLLDTEIHKLDTRDLKKTRKIARKARNLPITLLNKLENLRLNQK